MKKANVVNKWKIVNECANEFITLIENGEKISRRDVEEKYSDVYSWKITDAVKNIIDTYCEVNDILFPFDESGFND